MDEIEVFEKLRAISSKEVDKLKNTFKSCSGFRFT